MHEICFDEPGKGERARNNSVGIMGQAQQQKSYECNRNLNANGILGSTEEVADSAIGLTLALTRGIAFLNSYLRDFMVADLTQVSLPQARVRYRAFIEKWAEQYHEQAAQLIGAAYLGSPGAGGRSSWP